MKDKICVIGLGYVGLPLAHAFSEKYEVVGFDINKARIDELNSGFDRTLELDENQMKEAIKNGMKFTLSIEDIKDCNIYIVTVPTPIKDNNDPDLTPLIKSSQTVAKVLKQNDIVIYESTVYPGVTEEVCVPVLEKFSNLKFNNGFFCGYSPERINPGDKEHTVTKILKITSGSTPEIAKRVDELYKSIITAGTHLASSIKVAEAAKVIENSQRDINIAFMNELSIIFNKMDIDTTEVLEAAGTKWNFLKFSPGLVGGHCIGVDPYYLTYKAEQMGYHSQIILSGRRINDDMGKYVVENLVKNLIKADVPVKDAKVAILGFTFKENCPDTRNTRVIDIVNELKEYGINPMIADPQADAEEANHEYGITFNSIEEVSQMDAVIVAVGHNQFMNLEQNDFNKMFKQAENENKVLLDIKGVLNRKEYEATGYRYWRL